MARRRRVVFAVWGVVVAVSLALIPIFLDNVQGAGFATPGSESQRAAQVLQQRTGVGERAPLVIHASGPAAPSLAVATRELARVARATRGVVGVAGPLRDARGRTAALTVLLAGDDAARQATAARVQRRLDDKVPAGVTARLTGTSALFHDLTVVEEDDLVKAEAVGLPIAGLILLLAFGSAVAAGLPLLVAIAGLFATFGALGAVSTAHHFSSFIENQVVMIGLGVGIDYALLIVRRFREERERWDDLEAVAVAMATAGRTVIFSGMTVIISLASLLLVRQPFFTETSLGMLLVVALMVVTAVTLVPATAMALGDRIERFAVPRPGGRGFGWERWARFVMRRPWPVLAVALVLLGAMAWPVLDMRTGIDYGMRAYQSEPSAAGLATLQRAFPRAALSTVDLVVTARTPAQLRQASVAAARIVRADPRVGALESHPIDRTSTLLAASPAVAPDSRTAERLVVDLRRRLAADGATAGRVLVGGSIAETHDFSQEIRASLPTVVTAALVLCFLVLLVVFRSPLLALKAVVANLLSIAASFGLVVLVFQKGGGEGLLGFTSPGYLQTYVPLALFVLVYGLSMDYEVFIVSRMREEWERTGDTETAIAVGLQRTGGVVTSAAAIMVAVFSSFMLTRVPEIKQFGFGLAAAIAIDATIVRAALVPSVMRIAGRWNWWQPRWLARALERVPLAEAKA